MPKLARPLLLVAFEGWFDAGTCATGAVEWIRSHTEAETFAHIDPEEFFDFQENRPAIEKTLTGERVLAWPSVHCHAVHAAPPHDLVLVAGVEPRMRWRAFCEAVVEVAVATECQMVVTLGATAAGVPHSRPAAVKGSAANGRLAERLGLTAPTYQGPTGIIGTLHDMLDRASLPVISLRVGVPHYVAGPANPKGTRALLAELQHVTGVETHHGKLDDDVARWESRVSEATQRDPEIAAYIEQLETDADRAAVESLPSGDDLSEEIQKFLRSRNPDDDAADTPPSDS